MNYTANCAILQLPRYKYISSYLNSEEGIRGYHRIFFFLSWFLDEDEYCIAGDLTLPNLVFFSQHFLLSI